MVAGGANKIAVANEWHHKSRNDLLVVIGDCNSYKGGGIVTIESRTSSDNRGRGRSHTGDFNTYGCLEKRTMKEQNIKRSSRRQFITGVILAAATGVGLTGHSLAAKKKAAKKAAKKKATKKAPAKKKAAKKKAVKKKAAKKAPAKKAPAKKAAG